MSIATIAISILRNLMSNQRNGLFRDQKRKKVIILKGIGVKVMSWPELPKELESCVVSEISAKDKMSNTVIKPRKYRNNKPFAYGREWDSEKEKNRYEELLLLEKSGLISELKLQFRFLIVDTVKGFGRTLCKRYYYADFAYKERGNDKLVVEDVKSEGTKDNSVYRLKRQIVLDKYGDSIDFREIV